MRRTPWKASWKKTRMINSCQIILLNQNKSALECIKIICGVRVE